MTSLRCPAARQFARAVVAEAAAVAAAAGHPVPADQVKGIEHTVTAPGSAVTSSLSRDLIAGRPTEVDAVIGDLVDRAQALGLATPVLSLTALALRVHNRQLETPTHDRPLTALSLLPPVGPVQGVLDLAELVTLDRVRPVHAEGPHQRQA